MFYLNPTWRAREWIVRLWFAMLTAALLLALVAVPVLADAPGTGVVIEGVSVPGAELGYNRAQVETAFGSPKFCQSVEVGGDMASCSFDVDGGGQVDVRYRGAEGGNASNSPDDVAYHYRWSQAASGWTTTAGVNTALAIQDPDAAIAAYPNATVIYNPTFGNIESIEDKALGILIDYHFEYLSGTLFVSMAISYPTNSPPPPPPPEEHFVHVAEIDLTAGKRNVTAAVRVLDELDKVVSGATVHATWTLPNGKQQSVSGQTDGLGTVALQLDKARRRGTYTFRIEDVSLDGFEFEAGNSVLSDSISK
ncbi:MAG: Ig-like domain-containing protein [Anaerolineales bacterium]